MNLRFPAGCPHFKESDWDNYQLIQYRQFVKYSPHRKTALDCGAHAGIMTRRMSKDFKNVVSFEPVHYTLLTSNTLDLHNVDIKPFGVLDHLGIVPISINLNNSGDCVIGSGPDEIEVITIDWLDLRDISAIKMDVQGSEMAALVGAARTIQRDHPTLMLEIEKDDSNREMIEETMLEWDYVKVFEKNADRVYQWCGWR